MPEKPEPNAGAGGNPDGSLGFDSADDESGTPHDISDGKLEFGPPHRADRDTPESRADRALRRERAVLAVLSDGGIRVTMSYPEIDHYPLETRLQGAPQFGEGPERAFSRFFSPHEQRRLLMFALKDRKIREIVNIRRERRQDVIKKVIPGKKGFIGIGRTQTETMHETAGSPRDVMHSEIVQDGSHEPAVRLTYYVCSPDDWREYSGRTGQYLLAEIILPESTARTVVETLDQDPAAIRVIIERVMRERLLSDPEQWDKPQGRGDPLRPPYEKWDAETGGGKIYVQKESMEPGFHPEALRDLNL